MSKRIITGCPAAHPDVTGGIHPGMARQAVLVIDDEAGLGVWVSDGNRQPRMIENARHLLDVLKRGAR